MTSNFRKKKSLKNRNKGSDRKKPEFESWTNMLQLKKLCNTNTLFRAVKRQTRFKNLLQTSFEINLKILRKTGKTCKCCTRRQVTKIRLNILFENQIWFHLKLSTKCTFNMLGIKLNKTVWMLKWFLMFQEMTLTQTVIFCNSVKMTFVLRCLLNSTNDCFYKFIRYSQWYKTFNMPLSKTHLVTRQKSRFSDFEAKAKKTLPVFPYRVSIIITKGSLQS